MPKIRGVKPDLWTDDDFVELTPWARLLWIGMWNFACDNGHLQDKSKQIKMRVLPTDDVNCAELLREIAGQGLIERADGWITIPNLVRHQKVDRRYFTTCEKSGCTKPDANPERESRREHDVSTTGTRRGPDVDPTGPRGDGDGDGDGELMVKVVDGEVTPSRKRSETPPRFDEFWTVYDHKVGRAKAAIAYRAALRKPGVTPDLLIAAAEHYIAWVKSDGKHPQFTKHPTTWLNGEHWRDERVTRQQPLSRVQQHLALAQQLALDEQGATIHQIGDGR